MLPHPADPSLPPHQPGRFAAKRTFRIGLVHLVGPRAGQHGTFSVLAASHEAAIEMARRCWPTSLVIR